MREETFRSLEAGATLITENVRQSRAFTRAYHAFERDRGRALWRRPQVLPLDAFLDREWRNTLWQDSGGGQLALLTSWQEQLVWEQAIRESPEGTTLLQIPETARRAMETWSLIQAYRVPVDGRFEASDDWAAFAGWSREFERRCREQSWVSRSKLADIVAGRIGNRETFRLSPYFERPEVFRALGEPEVIEALRYEPAVARYRFDDASEEIRAAAAWARELLKRDAATQIGIVVPGLETLRGKVEHIFRETLDPAATAEDHERAFHVSLGPALAEYPLVHAALLALEFGQRGLALPQAGVLLRSPFIAGAEAEWSRRGMLDAQLRRRGVWEIRAAYLRGETRQCPILQTALERFGKAVHALAAEQSASGWSASFSKLLEALGWPGERTLSSREYQVVEAWRSALADFAALDLAAASMTFNEALSRLRAIAAATQFQIENIGASIQIMGLLEASGLNFDHLWIMGLHDEALPAAANPNPFIPLALQREHKLPHCSAEQELEFASNLLDRLQATAPDVVLSYPASENDRKLAPTPLVRDEWQTLKHASQDGWIARMRAAATLDELADEQAPAAPESSQPGGTSLFKDMAACYFRAFAQHRLHAKPLDEATLGLSYKDRGNAVHQALHRIWREIGSQARLAELSVAELSGLVARCVAEVVDRLPSGIGQRLEQRRLERLLGLWLEIEKSRDPFTVIASEESRSVNIAGFEITTRADRIDEVAPGREVILDYKTGNIKAGVWDGERPDEPQLPLYCATSGRPVAGAAFAVIRADELAFRGLTGGGVFLPDMKRMRIENEVAFSEQVARWRNVLVKLGEDFRDGDAGINPKHGACDHCRRWALCRIREFENAG